MSKFFINRPIVAMVISILMVIVGARRDGAAARSRSTRTSPRPRSCCTATYPGADALTLEQSVATPIEQQMSGVDNMLYMYSTSQTAGGQMQLRVNFDVSTDPSYDQVLTNLRYSQAAVAAAARRDQPGRHGHEVDDEPAGHLRRCTRRRAPTTRCSSATTPTSTSTTR